MVEDGFSQAEVDAMLDDVDRGGQRIAENVNEKLDSEGRTSRKAIWHEFGDDIWSAASTHPKIVNSIRILMDEDVAFFHGKVMFKEARIGGRWEWHQDYGYWYNQGYDFPRAMSAVVALDECTLENGCLQVLRGAHKLERLDQTMVGSQVVADPERLKLVEPMPCPSLHPGGHEATAPYHAADGVRADGSAQLERLTLNVLGKPEAHPNTSHPAPNTQTSSELDHPADLRARLLSIGQQPLEKELSPAQEQTGAEGEQSDP